MTRFTPHSLLFPPNLLILLVILGGLAWWLRKRKLAGFLIGTGLLWVFVWSLPVTTLILGGHLEKRYDSFKPSQYPVADAIVVLGGHIQGNRHNWFEPYDSERVTRRESVASELYHAKRAALILLSGGALEGDVSDTATMARTLSAKGIDKTHIIQETKSQNTFENARLTDETLRELAHSHILLVTSALHMPRAMTAFDHRPMTVTPVPVARQILWPTGKASAMRWFPDLHTLLASQSIIKEYVGLIIYWVHARLSAV